MKNLLKEISSCTICVQSLELGPRPVLSADPKSRIVVIGQAPGLAVHKSGVPWDDKSGDNLRNWMAVDTEVFYDPHRIALIPMGFCYPGKGSSGDLAPQKECAPQWHNSLLSKMKHVELVILVGKYSQDYYLKDNADRNLTATVKNFKQYLPKYFVLPHPSPRNNIWQSKNPWFQSEVIPHLQLMVNKILMR